MLSKRGLKTIVLLSCVSLTGCFSEGQLRKETNQSPISPGTNGNNLVFSDGPRSMTIIFKQTGTANPTGSFNIPTNPGSGTTTTIGEGHQVQRYFGSDDQSVIADALVNPEDMPPFVEFAEITLSGTSNPAARNVACSRFTPGTASSNTCQIQSGVAASPCASPAGFWAISEQACSHSSIPQRAQPGEGDETDPVRFLMKLDLSKMNSFENVRIHFTYMASTFRQNGQSQTSISCFTQVGNESFFNPQNPGCADLVWNAYIGTDLSQRGPNSTNNMVPIQMVVPPIPSAPFNGQVSAAPFTTEIILPLAELRNRFSSTEMYFMLTRINADATPSNSGFCAVVGNPSAEQDTALCHGLVPIKMKITRF